MIDGVKLNIQIPPMISWSVLVSLTCLVAVMMHFGILWTADLRYLWITIYVSSLLLIISRLMKGRLFEPIVIAPSAYLLILAIGSIFFEVVKARDYKNFLFNFIGMGYFSLFAGIYLTQEFHYGINARFAARRLFSHPFMKSRALTYVFALFCLLPTFGLFVKGGIPMLAADVNQARVDLITGNGILNIFFIGLTVFPLAILYDSISRGDKKALLFAHILAGLVFMLLFMTGYRSRTLTFLAEYLGIYYFFNRRRFSLKFLITLAALLVIFLAGVGAYRRGGATEISSLVTEVGIITAARPVMLELIVENFSESKFFHGTRYFGDLVKLLPGVQTGANVDLKYEVFPNADKMPDEAGVTPSIIGEAYMNFGAYGIFWVMLLFGALLGISYKFMVKKPSFMRCAFYFTFVIGMSTAVSGGIGTRLVHLIFLWVWVAIVGFLYNWRIST